MSFLWKAQKQVTRVACRDAGSSLIVAFYIWCPIPKITTWSGWLLLICRSGWRLASKKEKSVKKENCTLAVLEGRVLEAAS